MQHAEVGDQGHEQQQAVDGCELFIGCQGKHQQAGQDHHRDIHAYQLPGDPQRNDQRRQAQGDKDVEDAAADHAAHGDIRIAGQGGLQAHGHLWRAAAEGDDGQANDQRPHLEARGQAYGGPHQDFGADDQQQEAADQFQKAPGGEGG